MRYYKKIGAALCCALSLSLPALAANPWQDALNQILEQVPAVGTALKNTSGAGVVPITGSTGTAPAQTGETTGTTTGTAPAEPVKPAAPVAAKELDVVLVLDKSGSMKGLEKNTIDGYNTMLAKERKLSVPTEVTTVLFSSNYEILTDRQPIAQVSDMSEDTYTVRGATALYDAVGMAIDKMDAVKGIHDPGHQVIFVIITDGLENYSQKYDQEQIKKKIDAAQEQGWEFVFIGANMDAEKVASDLGIKEENAATYENSEKGVQANYKAVSQMVESLARTSSLVGSQWKNSIVRGN